MLPSRISAFCSAWRHAFLVVALAVLGPALPAQGQNLLEENFTFTGPLTSNGWTAVSGAGASPINATAPGLAYPNLPSSGVGNAASISTTGEDDRKALTATNSSGSIYSSCLINLSAAQTNGDYFYTLSSGATGFIGRVFARSSGSGFQLGILKSSGGVTTPTYDTNVLSFGTVYLIATKIERLSGTTTDDVASLWINPVLGGAEPTANATNSAGNDQTNIDSFVLRQGSATAAPTLRLGNILVGTTWASVTPTSSATAPSISSFTPTGGSTGTLVTINGSNLNGATSVTFNGAAAVFNVVNSSQITATVPVGATEGPISVTTPQGVAQSSTSFAIPTISIGLPAVIKEGKTGIGTLTLNAAAVADVSVGLSTSPTNVLTVDTPVVIGTGATSANFNINTSLVASNTPVQVSAVATGYASSPATINVQDVPAASLISSGYSQSFSSFTDAATLPLGWSLNASVAAYTAWATTDTGAKYSAGGVDVFGYQHTGSTGTVEQVLTLQNDTGAPITALTVRYNGRAARLDQTRLPSYTVTVDGVAQTALVYSTGEGDNVAKSAAISGLNIAAGQVFQIVWISDRGLTTTGTSRQIGISNVSVTVGASSLPPTVAGLGVSFSSITQTSAAVTANVVSDGGASLTARGFVYAQTSVNPTPAIGGPGVTVVTDPSTATGVLGTTLGGLSANTAYSVRAFATNAQGTSYSAVASFPTLAAPPSFTGSYAQNFDDFTATTSPSLSTGAVAPGWTAISSTALQTYSGAWTASSFSGGFFGGASTPGVLGYQHTSGTGTLTVTLQLVNNTGATLTQVNVQYLGRVTELTGTRFPEWAVTVAGVPVPALSYSTASGVDETKTALVTGLNVPNGQAFTITWVSSRGENAAGNSRRIGLANVVVGSAGPATPSIGATPSSLNLPGTTVGAGGAVTNFSASGANLIGDITVSVPGPDFIISTNSSSGFAGSLVLTNSGGVVAATPIFVRLSGASAGAFSNNISLASSNAATRTVALSGTVSPPVGPSLVASPTALTNLAAYSNAPGGAQTVAVSVQGGSLTNDITASVAGQGFEVAQSGAGVFGAQAFLPPGGGDLLVRIAQSNVVGPVGPANLALVSGSISNSVALSGARLSGAGITPGLTTFDSNLTLGASSQFDFALNANASVVRGTNFSGVNVGGNLTVNAGAVFNIVLNGTGSATDFANAFWQSPQSWQVFVVTGSTAGNFAIGAVSPDSTGKVSAAYGTFSLRTDAGGDVYLDWTPSGPAVPTVLVNRTSLLLPGTFAPDAGASTNFTASGANLLGDITVTANDAANFAVSTNASNGFAASLVLSNNSGSVATTPVYVRLTGTNIGPFTNTVSIASSNAVTRTVTVSGTVTDPNAPSISVNPSALSAFTTTQGIASAAQSFVVTGGKLTNAVVITPPAGFAISTNGTAFSTEPLTIPLAQFVSPTTVSVRLTGAAQGGPSGNVTVASSGATTQNVAVSGTVNPAPPQVLALTGTLTGFSTVQGVPSAAQQVTVRGSNLLTDVTVAAPANLEFSTNSAAGYGPSLVLPVAGGALSNTVFVRIPDSAAVGGPVTNTITASSGTATPSTLAAVTTVTTNTNAFIVAKPSMLSGFATMENSPSTNQTFVASGTNLTANLNIAAPSGYEISTNGTDFVTSLALVPGSVSAAPSPAAAPKIYNDATNDISTATGISTGGGTLDIVKMEVSDTATDLVFSLTVNGNISTNTGGTDWGNFMIGIGNGKAAGTTNSTGNGWTRPINMITPTNSGMTHWIGSWVNAGGGSQLWTYAGPTWDGPAALPGYTLTPGAQSVITYTVAQSALGVTAGDTIFFDAYSSGNGGTDSAVDALSNPNFAITAWAGPYTSATNTGLSSYTIGGGGGAGTVPATTIYVRIAANAPVTNNLSGVIALTSAGAPDKSVALSGRVTGIPVVAAAPAELPAFIALTNAVSPTNSFTVTGNYLTSNVTVTAPAPFRVSTNGSSGYAGTLELVPSAGALSNRVFVQIDTAATTNAVTNIAVSASGATPAGVAVQAVVYDGSGPQLLPPAPSSLTNFFTVAGNSSASLPYIVAATGLSNVAITNAVTAGFEISTDNVNFARAVTNRPATGGVATFTNYVRIASSASVNDPLTGSVAIDAAGTTGFAVSLQGTVAPVPTLGAAPGSFPAIWTVAGFPSAPQSVSLSASNLVATNRTLSVSVGGGGFEVSTNSTGGFASSLVITGESGSLSNLPLYARLTGAASGSVSTNVIVAAPAAGAVTNLSVPAAGTVLPRPLVSVAPAALAGLNAAFGYASAPTNFAVSGTNLLQGITVALTNGSPFEVSTNSTNGFTNFVVLEPLLVAADRALNYTNGWTNGANAGNGFGPWQIIAAAGATATLADPADSGITGMASTAFALGGTNGYADAVRTFAQPLAVGQRFSVRWGNNWDTGGSGNKGVNIYAGGTNGAQLLNINMSGTEQITINGQPMFTKYGSAAITLNFQYVATNTLFVHATGRDGIETYQNTFTVPGAPDAVKFYAGDLAAAGLANRLAFFDNLSIAAAATDGGGVISNSPVFVRLKAGAPLGPVAGAAQVTSGPFASPLLTTVLLSGTVDPAPEITVDPLALSGFSTTEGIASAPKFFDVSGANFRDEPVVVAAPAGYEAALAEGGPYSSQVVLGPFSGTFTGQRVHVRLSRRAPEGPAVGDVVLTSPLAANVTVPLDGLVLAPVDPGQNSEFVRLAARLLFYTELNDAEVQDVLDYLGWPADGQATLAQKAQAIAELSGYDASEGIFDWTADYAQISVAFAPFARLGLVPTAQQVVSFVDTVRNGDQTLLPFPATFNGLTGAPWWATRALAQAMTDFMAGPQFVSKFPTVPGLDTRAFYNWMNTVMFPGRAMGSEGPLQLTTMINTLTASDGRAYAQGAGVAFRSVYVSVLLTEARGSNDGSDIEKPFQRRANLAALNFQLWNNWSYAVNSAEYSVSNVAALLRAPVVVPPSGPVVVQAGASFGPSQIGVTSPSAPINQQLLFSATLDGFADLPDWLEFNRGTGEIQGTLPADVPPGTYTLRVTAENMAGVSAPQAFQIQVLPPPAGPGPEDLWLQAQGVEASFSSMAHLDLDGDGLTVLEEYLFGLGVHSTEPAAVTQTTDGVDLVLEWKTPKQEAWHRVEKAINLPVWSPFTAVAPVEIGANETHLSWRLTVPLEGARGFFRIVVGLEPDPSP